MKVLIISQPKSGTYLCANLLQELNLIFTGLHLNDNRYQKYNLNDIEDCKNNPKKYTIKTSLNKSIKLIEDNEFAVSHLKYSKKSANITSEFKKIILTRNNNEVLNSWIRWANDTNRPKTAQYIETYNQQSILEWLQESNTIHLTFDDLCNKNINAIDKLQDFLFKKIIFSSEDAIEQSLNKPSLTKSSLR